MTRQRTSIISAVGLAVCGLAAPAHGALLAGGTFGGGQLPENAALVYGPGTVLVSASPAADGRSVRVRATLRAACGGITFERTTALAADGSWSVNARITQRLPTNSVVGSVRMKARLLGDAGAGTAAVRLRVRTGKRVRRCVAPSTAFQVRRIHVGQPRPAPAPAAGGSLYSGLTRQSIPGHGYPIVIRTSPEGRTVTGVAYNYFCRATGGIPVETGDFLNRGLIAANGRFTWTHRYTLRARGLQIRVRIVVDGRFRAGAVTGTIVARGRFTKGTRVLNGCTPPEPIKFTAVI